MLGEGGGGGRELLGGGGHEGRRQLVEIKTNETEGTLRSEDGQEDVGPPGPDRLGQKYLTLTSHVVQPAERAPVQQLAQLTGRCVDAGGERARGHHVHGARKAVLRQHLPARMEQEGALGAGLGEEVLERTLDPGFDDGGLHQAPPPAALSAAMALSSSTRTRPTFTATSATTTSTSAPPPTAQSRP